jgi:hypothetical protein
LLKAALFSGTIVRDQASIGVKLMCEEVASLHRSAFTNTDSEILDYRPDIYKRNDNSAQERKSGVWCYFKIVLGVSELKVLD